MITSQKATKPITYQPRHVFVLLAVIIFAAAAGPVIIRQAQLAGLPSLYIIAARLIIASLVLFPVVWPRHRQVITELQAKEWLGLGIAGILFALNLLFLFLSLEYTSVLVTSIMRRTSPLWVIGLETLLFGAVFTRRVWLGLGFTLTCAILVALGSGSAIKGGSQPILGAIIALFGAVGMSVYLLIGRSFRERLPSLAYSWLVFVIAGISAIAIVIITNTPYTGFGWTGVWWIFVITFITQFMGHIPINLGLQYMSATMLSMAMQGAVVLSALLAFLFFGQIPSWWQVVGSAGILWGVYWVNRR